MSGVSPFGESQGLMLRLANLVTWLFLLTFVGCPVRVFDVDALDDVF